MRIFRRTGTLTLLCALVFIVVGCSSEVKLGAIISESGPLADPYGRSVRRGIDLALEEINAEGGFKGQPVQLVFRDDGSDAGRSKAAAKELIDIEGVKAIIGGVSSTTTLAIAPLCEENRVILLSPSASAPAITDAGEYIFRNYPSDILEGTRMADFARSVGVRSVAVVVVDNEFGRGLRDVFASKFESRTRKIVETYTFPENDTSSFPEIVAGVKELKPSAVYILAYLDALTELLTLFHESEVSALLMASGAVTEDVTKQAGEAAENLVYAQPSVDKDSDDPAVASFIKAYTDRYGESPNVYAAHGYDALKVIWTAMTTTGFAIPDEIKRGLLNMSYQGAAGRTSFDVNGDVVRYPRLFIIRDGVPVSYEQFEADGGTLSIPSDA